MQTSALHLERTDSSHPDFTALVKRLDADLLSRYGEQQKFFDQFNKLDAIKNVIVAYVDGKPAGCGAFKFFEDGKAEIKRMYVADEFRRMGVAKQVLQGLEDWARELGYSTCVLETAKNQPEAIALYQRAGYNVTENYGQYIGVAVSICMAKNLH